MTENQTCPVPLDYPDAQPISLDVPAIRGAGIRIRRRRRIAATATAGVLAVAVSAGLVALRPSSGSSGPAAGTGLPQIADILARNPPLHDPVVISAWPPHWTTVAWATADGQFCHAEFRTPASGTGPQSACDSIEGDLNADFASGATVGMPLPAMAPMEDHQTYDQPGGQPTRHPFVGVARGRVAQVAVVVHGRTFTAAVTPLTVWQGDEIGVFQLWIATGNSWDSTDIQSVVAYDSQGSVIARQGQWIAPAKPGT